MYKTIDSKILKLAQLLKEPLYVVGGYVRNYLINGSKSEDVDLASPLSAQNFRNVLKKIAPEQVFEYKNTGTVAFTLSNVRYEYTQFREESYLNGEHKPSSVNFVTDINIDARRRDFKCNAVYYDLKNKEFIDLLGGIEDIKNKRLDTVVAPEKVFSCDGLRLMRLARFSGELNFTPTKEVIKSATENSTNIYDISSERILEELKKILVADKKSPFYNPNGHVKALSLLKEIGVLEKILNLNITSDFNMLTKIKPELRFICFILTASNDINTHKIEQALKNLKVDKKTYTKTIALLQSLKDVDCIKNSHTVREFLLKHYNVLEDLFNLESAFPYARIDRIKLEYEKAKSEGAPFSEGELKIDAKTLIGIGYIGSDISLELNRLKKECVITPSKNNSKTLTILANKHLQDKRF